MTYTGNHMIDGDPGTSPQSPYYKGEDCATCGEHTKEVDFDGNCSKCEQVKCVLCDTKEFVENTVKVLDRHVCTICVENVKEEGEVLIDDVRQVIRYETEKLKPILTTNNLHEMLNSFIH